jgi:hypothetical protein
MNIFYLHKNPKDCAEMHLDKHVVKMIIEYAQLMSTAHRLLDGQEYFDLTSNGRKIKRWRVNDEREGQLMKASHINHPSAIWTRASDLNYNWLYNMWCHLLDEYTYRYGKIHACARLKETLKSLPKNISIGYFTEPTPAMPDECKIAGDSLASYHKYYLEKKNHFAKWTKRQPPIWYIDAIDNNAHV